MHHNLSIMTEQTVIARFVAAVQAGKDDMAEVLATALLPTNEPTLLEMIQATDSDQCWWAIRALALCGTTESTSALRARFADPDATLRAGAAMAIGQMHQRGVDISSSTLSQLTHLLMDPDGLVRQTAADALAQCGDDAVDALDAILAGEHDGARTRAAYALRKIATMRVAPTLYQHLNDPNYLVRTYAYEALDEMGLLENVLVLV